MKTKARYKFEYLNEFKEIIVKHINLNLKDYLVLSIIFIIGVMVGVVIINNSDENSKLEISGYINSFIQTIKSNEYQIDKFKLTEISILENLKLVLMIWIAGSTVIGIPLIYIIMAYKGLCIGYTVSAIIASLGTWKRDSVFFVFFIVTKYNCYTYNFDVKC